LCPKVPFVVIFGFLKSGGSVAGSFGVPREIFDDIDHLHLWGGFRKTECYFNQFVSFFFRKSMVILKVKFPFDVCKCIAICFTRVDLTYSSQKSGLFFKLLELFGVKGDCTFRVKVYS